jgi:hypothetical protein
MRKFLLSPTFIFATIIAIAITIATFIAVQKTSSICQSATETCRKTPVKASEMLWDRISRHFVTLVAAR